MIKYNLFQKNNIQSKYINKFTHKILSKKFKKIFLNIERDIKKSEKTLNILNNKFKFNFNIKELKKFKKFNTIAIIGMGGSILGTEAIYGFLKKKINKKVYFFNDIQEKKILNLKTNENLSKVLFIIISKSGNTIETLSNALFLKIFKKNSKNIIIISENNNNALYELAKKFNLFYIEHKDYIGGRFSVLSEVGILPSLLMGVNINRLRSKILKYIKGDNKTFLKESSIKLASLMNSKKFNNLIFLNYSPELEKFLFWCQQLIAESLGKKHKGFLPVISNVPKDHHSLLQLYLDGPRDKIFNIFSVEEKSKEIIKVDKRAKSIKYLNKKKLSKIKEAQKNALKKALVRNKIPFREFKLKTIDEEVLGQLFSYYILETVIIGKLLNINPYDQPAVEQVKFFTKKFLN